jgi:hypothetical protein
MTRKILHISLMIIGFIILTSKSCEPDTDIDQEARLKAEKESALKEIKNDFESDYLGETQLMAYGEKAKQKLFDFADYLSLYSGKNIDTLFKQQVKDMIGRLFYNHDAIVQLPVFPAYRARNKKSNLTDLFCSIDASRYKSIAFAVSDLKTIEPFHLVNGERYSGKIGCCFNITGITQNDTTLLYKTFNQVNIIATRTSKQFGSGTSLLIWQVFLVDVVVAN